MSFLSTGTSQLHKDLSVWEGRMALQQAGLLSTVYGKVSKRARRNIRIKGCYKCTSFKHAGSKCYIRKAENCTVVTGGVTCSGAHNKLLHGSGIAFCHKVRVDVRSQETALSRVSTKDTDTDRPPDIMQPVLLEVQPIKVHG